MCVQSALIICGFCTCRSESRLLCLHLEGLKACGKHTWGLVKTELPSGCDIWGPPMDFIIPGIGYLQAGESGSLACCLFDNTRMNCNFKPRLHHNSQLSFPNLPKSFDHRSKLIYRLVSELSSTPLGVFALKCGHFNSMENKLFSSCFINATILTLQQCSWNCFHSHFSRPEREKEKKAETPTLFPHFHFDKNRIQNPKVV